LKAVRGVGGEGTRKARETHEKKKTKEKVWAKGGNNERELKDEAGRKKRKRAAITKE